MTAVLDHPERPLRADARRNREAVVRAAAEVFAQKGLEAGVPEIAARAGVGKATVYRSFPSKEHLIAAVACERLAWIEQIAREALDDDDPGAAFEHVLVEISERQAADRAVVGSMVAAAPLPELQAAHAAVGEAIEALMERAREAGALRADATGEDLRVLFSGVAHTLRQNDQRDPEVWRRYGALIAAALRA